MKAWLILIMGVIKEVKNFICQKDPYEYVWVQL